MAAQALYRKWRSQTFDEVVGQEHVAVTLRNALREGRMSHAYLFTGPRGTGKTSTARILAKAINCLAEDPAARPCNTCRICTAINEGRQLDLIEIDAASNRGIDEIRDLREKIGFRPNEARYKVYIIDEVHMLTKEAFNALLKTLEEPPPHAVFVLATTEPDRVPETVRSRCQRFDFRRIPTAEIVEHLTDILKNEGARAETEALVAIARRSTGSMRDALSLLDQLLSYGDEILSLERVEGVLGLVNAQTIGHLVDHMAAGDTADGLVLINRLVADGVELGQLVDEIVAYLRGVLFVRATRASEQLDLPQDVIAMMMQQAEALTIAAILTALREFTEARGSLRDQVPGAPQLPIEMAFLRSVPSSGVTGVAVDMPMAQPTAAAVPSAAGGATQPLSHPATPPPSSSTETGHRIERQAEPSQGGDVQPEAASHRSTQKTPVAVTGAVAEIGSATEDDLLKAVREGWDRFIKVAGPRCGMKIQAALRGVKQLDVAGGVVVMYFSHAFSRDLVNQAENRTLVESVWQEVLGRKVGVRCALAGETLPAFPATPPSIASAGPASASDDEVLLDDARKLGAVIKHLK